MNRDYLLEQLELIEEYLERARSLAGHSRDEFLADWMKVDAAVRGLSVLFETSHNIAKHLIASRGWATAASKAGAFEVLAQEKVLPEGLADSLRQAARFRNLITYQTAIVNNDVVYDVLNTRLGDYEQFASQVARWIELHPEGSAGDAAEILP